MIDHALAVGGVVLSYACSGGVLVVALVVVIVVDAWLERRKRDRYR